MSAAGTLLRGVARIDQLDRDARSFRLVRYLEAQVCECPSVQIVPSRLANRYPCAKVRQVFQRYCAPGVLSLFDDLLTDAVVHVLSEKRLAASALLQQALSGFRAFLLQLAAQAAAAVTHVQQVLGAVDRAVTIGSDALDAHINAEIPLNVYRSIRLDLAGRVQVELATAIDEIGFAALMLQQLEVVLAARKRHDLTTRQRPNRHAPLTELPAENAIIVGNSAVTVKCPLHPLIQPVGVNHLANAANRYLRRQAELFAHRLIRQTVNRHTPELLCLPCHVTDKGTSGIGAFQRFQQEVVLLHRRLKSHNSSQFHTSDHSTSNRKIQHRERSKGAIPPHA